MTAATAALCGHRWMEPEYGVCPLGRRGQGEPHRCLRPDHHDDEPATSCRCRCGATTTRERTDR